MTSKAWRERLKRLEGRKRDIEMGANDTKYEQDSPYDILQRICKKDIELIDLEIQACITGLAIAK